MDSKCIVVSISSWLFRQLAIFVITSMVNLKVATLPHFMVLFLVGGGFLVEVARSSVFPLHVGHDGGISCLRVGSNLYFLHCFKNHPTVFVVEKVIHI